MTEFTPLSAALSGLLIGLAVALLLLANGRIAGVSGILGNALWPGEGEERGWRAAFLVGLPLGAGLVALAAGPLSITIEANTATLVAA